ncbi:MAG: hypothetical protein GQ540_06945 [Lutibacter sp.]|nr:hypothetical protein [Lutibacter sp.]
MDSRMLSKEISTETTISPTDVNVVLFALGEKLQFHLQEDKTVELEKIRGVDWGLNVRKKKKKKTQN